MNLAMLTGEVGSGKTITKNVLISSLDRHEFEVIDFKNSNFPFADLLYDICDRCRFNDSRIEMMLDDLPDRGDKYGLMRHLSEIVERLHYEENRHLVLIFDEAQQMSSDTIDELKNLTNVSSGTENFLTIFLIGQPELREKIRNLKQVDQRVYLRFHLNNLDFNNSVDYIQQRMRFCGLDRMDIFSSLAYEYLFRSTAGSPRELNRICKLSLQYGFSQSLSQITREDIEVIVSDLVEHS